MSDQFVDDLQALLDEPGHAPKHKMCAVGLVLESVTDEQREKLEILLQDGCPVASGKVADTLRRWGFPMGYNSVQRHRRRHRGTGCLCP
jgi:uncharacterized metal-binding protein